MEQRMIRMFATVMLGVTLAVLATVGAARAADDLGPATGSTLPDMGTPLDQTGTPRDMASLMGEKGVVLFFFRSAAWCPYCQAQLIELNTGVADMEKTGYRLAGLSYDLPDVLKSFADKRGLAYTLLSDSKSEVIDRYGLRDTQYPPGSKAYGVPKPIVFIVSRAGTIEAKLYEDSFRKRPPLALVLETLAKAAAAGSKSP
jgi:peroxiredoxin